MLPLGMAIQDLAIFTTLSVFVVLPSSSFSLPFYYFLVAVFTAVLFGCIAPVVFSIGSCTSWRSLLRTSSVSWCTSSWFASGRSPTTLVLGFLFKF